MTRLAPIALAGLLAACNQVFGLARTDSDSDGDGVPDSVDNCPGVANPDQSDRDGDGIGDACDSCPTIAGPVDSPDEDNDGILDACDDCPGTSNHDQADADGDGIGDVCDLLPTAQMRVVFDGFDPSSKVWDMPWPDKNGALAPATLPSTMHLVGVTLADQTPGAWHVDLGLVLQPAANPGTFGLYLHDPSQPSSNDAFCGVSTQLAGIAPFVSDANVTLGTGALLPAGRLVTLRVSLTTYESELALSCAFGGVVFALPLVAPLQNGQLSVTAAVTDTITYIDVVE